MFDAVRSAIRLDVVKLLPVVSNPDQEDRRWQHQILNSTHLDRIGKFLRRMVGTWVKRPGKTALLVPGAVFIPAYSINQRRALEPIEQALRERGVATYLSDAPPSDAVLHNQSFWSSLYAVPFFPVVLLRMLTAQGFARRSFAWGFDSYWLAFGAYVALRRWLRKHRTTAVVVSNDHGFWPRVLIAAARAEGVPSAYVQHAPVTKRFPALSMDYALLEGRKSLEIYSAIGPSTARVFLVGMPRFDQFVDRRNQNTQARTIGLCVALLDEFEALNVLVCHLVQACPDQQFVVRLHPRSAEQSIERWRAICEELKLDYSDSRSEHPFEFLARVDVVIAGGSGIILEAALANVTPIMVALNPDRPDWYGFAADGLCPLFSNPEEVSDMLSELRQYRPSVIAKARPYCATLDTPYDGKSAELVAQLIQEIADRSGPDLGNWQQVYQRAELEAYELA